MKDPCSKTLFRDSDVPKLYYLFYKDIIYNTCYVLQITWIHRLQICNLYQISAYIHDAVQRNQVRVRSNLQVTNHNIHMS